MSSNLSAAAEAIQQTLAEFRCQYDQWENEFDAVLDELVVLEAAAPDALLGELKGILSHQQLQLVERQEGVAGEVSAVRHLVEQQVRLLDRLLESGLQNAVPSVSAAQTPAPERL